MIMEKDISKLILIKLFDDLDKGQLTGEHLWKEVRVNEAKVVCQDHIKCNKTPNFIGYRTHSSEWSWAM